MWYFVAFSILLVTQVADVFFTKVILENGGRELNWMTDLVIINLGWAALLLMKSLPALIGMYNAARWQDDAYRMGGLVLAAVNSAVFGMTAFYVMMMGFYIWVFANGLHL